MAGSAHPLQQCLLLHFQTSQRSRLLEGHLGLAQVWTQALVVLVNPIPVPKVLPPQAPWTNLEAGSTPSADAGSLVGTRHL